MISTEALIATLSIVALAFMMGLLSHFASGRLQGIQRAEKIEIEMNKRHLTETTGPYEWRVVSNRLSKGGNHVHGIYIDFGP